MTGIPPKTITMKIKEGLTLNEKKKSEIMAKDFKNIFYANATPIQTFLLLTSMLTLFTSSEISKTVWTLKSIKALE